jgi:alpha-L-arabinofuranosidase
MMRYPGGTLADFFDWRAGQSYNTSQRGQCAVAIGTTPMQTVVYGTREFLEFCMDAGAEPLITVNIWNSSAQDAADWVKATNIDGYFTYASGMNAKIEKSRLQTSLIVN